MQYGFDILICWKDLFIRVVENMVQHPSNYIFFIRLQCKKVKNFRKNQPFEIPNKVSFLTILSFICSKATL